MVAVRVGIQGDSAVGCKDGEVLGCHYAERGCSGEASWGGSDHIARSVSSPFVSRCFLRLLALPLAVADVT